MKSSLFFVAACSVLALGGCLIKIDGEGDAVTTSYVSETSGYGYVYAANVTPETIAFTVSDNGCTDKSFFDINVRKVEDNEFKVALERVRQDHCKAFNPDGKTVSWTFRELGIPDGAQITVLNGVRRSSAL